MTSITNLSVAIAGLTTIGGMVYGGYELLKDVPKPVTELLKIKKKTPLKKDSDADDWKKNWQQYIKDHTTTETVTEPDSISATATSPQQATPKTTTKEVVKGQDIWSLSDWKNQKDKKEEVPNSFKEKCETKLREQQNGIWTQGYKNFEKYCTKDDPSDD